MTVDDSMGSRLEQMFISTGHSDHILFETIIY